MKALEELLFHSQLYYDSPFEHSEWPHPSDRMQLGLLEKSYHDFTKVHNLLRRNNVVEAFQLFEAAFDLVGPLLKQQHVLFVAYLYHLILHIRHQGGHEVFTHLFNRISKMIER
jgi:hypothetical protein